MVLVKFILVCKYLIRRYVGGGLINIDLLLIINY